MPKGKYIRKAKKMSKEERKIYFDNYYKNNKEKIKIQSNEWKDKNPIRRREILKKNQIKAHKENPLIFNARLLALRHIKIPIGYLCEICNKNLAVHRHHDDYNKPLEVSLICKKCHIDIHNAERNDFKLKKILFEE